MKAKKIIKLLVRFYHNMERRLTELENMPHCEATPALTRSAPATALTRTAAPEPKGLAALFDQKPNGITMYRHTCACGTPPRSNSHPSVICLKCKQPMMSSIVTRRNP